MLKSESIGNLAKALANLQSELEPLTKDSTAKIQSQKGSYSYEYLSFGNIWDACRPLLSKNGLSICQPTETSENHEVIVETVLMHESGEWISGKINLPITQNTPQAVGSAITYGRRYGFASLVGIVADEDDDAASASNSPKQKPNNVTPINQKTSQSNTVSPKIQQYREELVSICTNLKYSEDSKKNCLAKFDGLKTDEDKYQAVIKMRGKLAEYNKLYQPTSETETVRDVAVRQDERPKPSPRELAALQIFEALKDGDTEMKLTTKGDSFVLFAPGEKDEWMDFIIKPDSGKTTCDCTAYKSLSRSKPDFKCEHINGINKYLEWQAAMAEEEVA